LSPEPRIVHGAVQPGLDVRLAWCAFDVSETPLRRSPSAVRERLRGLSDRHGGAHAISQHTREIPEAYDILLRRLGEERRSPPEALTVARLIRGAYRSFGLLRDALTIAMADTEVGVWALDADRLSGDPRIADRSVADDAGPIVPLFASPESVTRETRQLLLYAIVAPGIPDLAVEEALYTAWEVIVSA
jgi:hypothetical protein